MTKGTMLFAAVVLVFVVMILAIYLYYDFRLEQIHQTLQQLPNA